MKIFRLCFVTKRNICSCTKNYKFSHYNQFISSLAMATKANSKVTVINQSLLWQWQPKPIAKSL